MTIITDPFKDRCVYTVNVVVNLNSNFRISIGIDIVGVFTLNTSSPYITAITVIKGLLL